MRPVARSPCPADGWLRRPSQRRPGRKGRNKERRLFAFVYKSAMFRPEKRGQGIPLVCSGGGLPAERIPLTKSQGFPEPKRDVYMPTGRQFAAYLWAFVLAAGVFWLAYDEGTYGLTSRNSVAVVVLWAIVLAS